MKKLMIGMSVWGTYVDTFFDYCWPSLNTEGNLPALKKHFDVGFLVHTDKAGAERFKDVGIAAFNDAGEGDKYGIIGKHQNYDLTMAKIMGADYHLMMPDFVYSENCFTGVLKAIERGHKAITRLVVSTNQDTLSPLLHPNVSASELVTLGLLHMHPGVKHWLATKEGYPKNHVLVWEGKNTLHMCSPHQTPVYIANEVINPVPSDKPLDAILDQIIIGDIYCPKPEDEMVIIEMSPGQSRKSNDERVDLKEFCRISKWDMKESLRQLYIFDQETIDPINRDMLGKTWWNDVEISIQKRKVMGALTQSMGM